MVFYSPVSYCKLVSGYSSLGAAPSRRVPGEINSKRSAGLIIPGKAGRQMFLLLLSFFFFSRMANQANHLFSWFFSFSNKYWIESKLRLNGDWMKNLTGTVSSLQLSRVAGSHKIPYGIQTLLFELFTTTAEDRGSQAPVFTSSALKNFHPWGTSF